MHLLCATDNTPIMNIKELDNVVFRGVIARGMNIPWSKTIRYRSNPTFTKFQSVAFCRVNGPAPGTPISTKPRIFAFDSRSNVRFALFLRNNHLAYFLCDLELRLDLPCPPRGETTAAFSIETFATARNRRHDRFSSCAVSHIVRWRKLIFSCFWNARVWPGFQAKRKRGDGGSTTPRRWLCATGMGSAWRTPRLMFPGSS